MKRLAGVVLAALACASCAAPPPTTGSGGVAVSLTVFAAASLDRALPAIESRVFHPAHPGLRVTFSYDGSSGLVDQLAGGARADVLATADAATMGRAERADLVTAPSTFAKNSLVLITPAGNPAHVTGLDSSLNGHKLVVCAAAVPCGAATRTLAANLGYTLRPVSAEQKVTGVVAKVTSGEADAGVVYATDAAFVANRVTVVPLPGAERVLNEDRIAVTTSSRATHEAREFLAAVHSPEGRAILESYGFLAP